MRKTTYARIAEQLAVPLCTGIWKGMYDTEVFDHEAGQISPSRVIHWRERRVQYPGLRRFLVLVARWEDAMGGYRERNAPLHAPDWLATYLYDKRAALIAQNTLRIRIPAVCADLDRALVRAQLHSVPMGTPYREEAMKWAAKLAQV